MYIHIFAASRLPFQLQRLPELLSQEAYAFPAQHKTLPFPKLPANPRKSRFWHSKTAEFTVLCTSLSKTLWKGLYLRRRQEKLLWRLSISVKSLFELHICWGTHVCFGALAWCLSRILGSSSIGTRTSCANSEKNMVCVFVHVYAMCIYIWLYMYAYDCICMCMYIVYLCLYIYTYEDIYMYTYIYTHILCVVFLIRTLALQVWNAISK